MLFGARGEGEPVRTTPPIITVPLIAGLVGCAALGVLAWPLDSLLRAAAMVVVR
jgi:hypothetical protein